MVNIQCSNSISPGIIIESVQNEISTIVRKHFWISKAFLLLSHLSVNLTIYKELRLVSSIDLGYINK